MLEIVDAGVLGYRPAWDLQLQLHERVMGGELADGALILVEHPPVVTIGRRPDAKKHLLVAPALLEANGVELVETDRGGDITFHGPGQLVAYPIINLNRYGLNLHAYMRLLETVTMQTLAGFGIDALRVDGCTGVWFDPVGGVKSAVDDSTCATNKGLEKICAIGVKLRRWTTLHGLALNVTTDLKYFELINACGLSRPVITMGKILGEKAPSMADVKRSMAEHFKATLNTLGKNEDARRLTTPGVSN
jgi:lipoate-protein ligase B